MMLTKLLVALGLVIAAGAGLAACEDGDTGSSSSFTISNPA